MARRCYSRLRDTPDIDERHQLLRLTVAYWSLADQRERALGDSPDGAAPPD
jgi:hypothetical protein